MLDFALRFFGQPGFDASSWPTVGVGLATLLCLVSVSVPWRDLPHYAVGVLPVLDVAAVGMARLDPQTSGAGVLVVIPAVWLGREFGRPGAVTALVASVLLMAVPGFVYSGGSAVNVSRLLLINFVVLSSALALAIASALHRAQQGQLEAELGRSELAAALDLIEHQRRFSEAILDTVDVGLVLLDRNGAYASVNKRHADFMALAFPEGHAGQAGQLGLVFGPDGRTLMDKEGMPSHLAACGEEFDDSLIWVGDDPLTRRALSVSARTVRDGNGDFAGAALAYKDVSEFVHAIKVKDEFIASVSHELRTPLTSIIGYVQMLQERDDLTGEVHGQLDVVSRNSERLSRLVADLLHTAQSDEGPMSVVRVRADLSRIVRDSVQAALPQAQALGTTLDVETPPELLVLVDPQRMAQVVDNLVSNAIKYTPAGGRIAVCLRIDGTRVELAVTDTGVGSRSRASRGMAAPSGCGCRAGPTATDSARVPIGTRTPDRRVRCRRGRCRRSPGRG